MTEKKVEEVKAEAATAEAEVKAEKAKKPVAKKATGTKRVAKRATTKKDKTEKKDAPAAEFVSAKDKIEAKVNLFFETNKDNKEYKRIVSVSKLMEAYAHVGLPANMWNPKMAPFIYRSKANRNLTIDILKIIVFLNRAYNFLHDIAAQDGKVLFVGTHNDMVKKIVAEEATRCGSYFINQRWLGGTLTNYKTVANSINKLNRLIALVASENFQNRTKKEQISINKQIAKLERFIGGIKEMKGLPQVVIVTDPIAEHNAVKEARDLNIPVIAIANTNANPNLVDFIIPANTHSPRAEYLILGLLADAIVTAKGGEAKILGKTDEEIILPEVQKPVRKVVFVKKQADNFVKEEKVEEEAK